MKQIVKDIRSASNRELLAEVSVGGRVWFEEERLGYTVQARSFRYLVCTKPFNPRKTVLYTVVDVVEDVRGTENLVFGGGAETMEQCEEMLARLEGAADFTSEVSHRNRIPLHVVKTETVVGAWPSARSDPPVMSSSGEVTGPVFISELSASGEKPGAVGKQ